MALVGYLYVKDPNSVTIINSKDWDDYKKDLKVEKYEKLLLQIRCILVSFLNFPDNKFREYYDNDIVKKIDQPDAGSINLIIYIKIIIIVRLIMEFQIVVMSLIIILNLGGSLPFTGNNLTGYLILVTLR